MEDRDALLDFPFVSDGRPGCVMAVPDDAGRPRGSSAKRSVLAVTYAAGALLGPQLRVLLEEAQEHLVLLE